jgi:ATP-binding cassette subfamily E protein 1
MVRTHIESIRFEDNKPVIIEQLCSGCGICVKKCPFKAISIVNLPDELEAKHTHRFGKNAFKLYRLPVPLPGIVLGLLGQNGIGKTTTLNIFSNELKLNLGNHEKPPSWGEIVHYFRGSTLQDYFKRMSENKLKIVHKPQYVDNIPKVISGKVGELLEKGDEREILDKLAKKLDLKKAWNRSLEILSGGELQRVAVAATICKEADVYLFDEPSSYLDVKQRLEVAKAIRSLKQDKKIIIVAEHDLAIIDYLSDHICLFYGQAGVYGIVSKVHGVRTGINLYLQGYIPDENVRFRKNPILFHEKPPTSSLNFGETLLKWAKIEKTYPDFDLIIKPGNIKKGEIIGILGPNGIGKTTFVKILAGIIEPDNGKKFEDMKVSYKPQYISAEFKGTVKDLLMITAKEKFTSSWYTKELLEPLEADLILEKKVSQLSGGELQKTAIAVCLSQEAELYLFDEPSAYLDVEERLNIARVIRRIIETNNVTAFVVEHDVVAQDFVADRLMVFSGKPGINGVANKPTSLRKGMNAFLKEMEVTFRRDATTKRPRVNKGGSKLDKYQKQVGEYYYVSSLKTDLE